MVDKTAYDSTRKLTDLSAAREKMHKNVSIDAYTVPDNTKNIMVRAMTTLNTSMKESKLELQNMAAAQIA